MMLGSKLGGTSHDRGSWLVLCAILVAVLAPTACVLWLMNEAVDNQRDAARQKLSEAYRSQLALLRDQLDGWWEKRAAELDRRLDAGPPAAVFEASIRAGLADAAVCFGGDRSESYPAPLSPPSPAADERNPEWVEARAMEGSDPRQASAAYQRIALWSSDLPLAARAAQAQVRTLLQAGYRADALAAIGREFAGPRLARAVDHQGRNIAADAWLLALQLQPGSSTAAARLHALLSDYRTPMPSAQRLFLLGELRAAAPGTTFPLATEAAERLASLALELGQARPGDPALRAAGLPDIWKLTSPSGRVVAFYRSATVLGEMRRLLAAQHIPPGLVFAVTPPGAHSAAFEAGTPAGRTLPGWHLSLSYAGGRPGDAAARPRLASYVWIGFLAIAASAILAAFAAQTIRRQMRLARLKSDLVAAVSHELKTPLSSMRLLVDSLLDEPAFDPRKTREYLELIAQENLRLSRLIDNFLTFSRMERNRPNFAFAATNAGAVVEAVRQAAGERFHAPSCAFETEVAPGLPPLRADADALVTVLLNLLDNAYKFTPPDKRIALRAAASDGAVRFTVSDNGIGIPSREQKKIFRRFYQVDRRLSREHGGVGLGLSIVEFIVGAHGGAVSVESRPGAGSAFTVSLPAGGAGEAAR